MKRNTKRKNEGITLIALVITIIVLLILAGVTIAMLMGDNGILTKATEAKNDQADATVEEAVELLWNEYQLEIKSSSNERVEESTKIASTEITKIQGEETNYLATTATSFWDFLLTDKKVINADGIVDVQKLTGQTLDRGNGTDGVTDVYKIEKDAETNVYTLKYCVKPGEEESIWNVTEIIDRNVKKLKIEDSTNEEGYIEIQYEEGMTWENWINSGYNSIDLQIGGDGINHSYLYVPANDEKVLCTINEEEDGYTYAEEVMPDDTINNNYYYRLGVITAS